jgi:hypothetical protein
MSKKSGGKKAAAPKPAKAAGKGSFGGKKAPPFQKKGKCK